MSISTIRKAWSVLQLVAAGRPEARARILVVDDEPDVLYVCEKALEQSYSVTGFSVPEEALASFRTNAGLYDLVLTDVRMPTISGFELAREIRALRKDIPIIFMSAHEIIRREFENAFPAADGMGILTKPFSISTLTRFVAKHANSKS